MKHITLLILAAISIINTFAQNQKDPNVEEYIEKYKYIAITEQIRTGIPAAIKLAQGIHETNAGKSELCTNANNHFGIKCKNTWQGQTYAYTDDAKNECFRKYNSDIESYHDHSDFLKNNKRYEPLFALDITDYKAWATQLKASGYATNPKYTQRLVETIERYDLQQYTLLAQNRNTPQNETITKKVEQQKVEITEEVVPKETIKNEIAVQSTNAKSGENTPTETHYTFNKSDDTQISIAAQKAYNDEAPAAFYVTTERNGLKGFYARKGDVLLEQAIKNKIRYAKLLEINDLKDEALQHDMFIYTERKHKKGITASYIVQSGETLSLISQKTGVQLNTIRQLNRITEGFEPLPGERINLQESRNLVPKVVNASEVKVDESAQKVTTIKKANENDFIATNNTEKIANEVNNATTEIKNETQNTINERETANVASEVKKVNIADEPAIEDIIESERNTNSNNTTATPQTTTEEEDENLTPFEKLRKHMDKTVQNSSKNTSNSGNGSNKPNRTEEESFVTTPAKQNTNVSANNGNNTTNKKTTNTTAKAKTHKVQKGDTLSKIADKYKVSVNQLKQWNGLKSNNIAVGKVLKVSA